MLYREAIAQAMVDALTDDSKALVLGVGVGDVKGVFGTTVLARQRFPGRVIETPLSENMLTGALCGLALEGWHPMLVHARMDFMPLTFEHVINTLAKWRFVHGTGSGIGVTIRCIVGRGWGQGPQHSQALHAMLGHVPGLRVLLPFTPQDAYDAVRDAYRSETPTVIMEHRRLYETDGIVDPKHGQRLFGPGSFPGWPNPEHPELVIISASGALPDCVAAVRLLRKSAGVSACLYVVDSLPLQPRYLVAAANHGQGRVVVVDVGHASFGLCAEVARVLSEAGALKAFASVTPPFAPCPTSAPLEAAWYPTAEDIARAAMRVAGHEGSIAFAEEPVDGDGIEADAAFKGPF